MSRVESSVDERLVASGLVGEERFSQCRAELPKDADNATVLKHFVKQAVVTSWQAAQLQAGRVKGFFLGPYKLLAPLGAGGMGKVFQAADTRLDKRRVAIKVLSAQSANRAAVQRFRQEAETSLQLQHPNIVRTFELGQHKAINYLVMELVEGPNLGQYLAKRGQLTVEQTAHIGLQVAKALEYANDVGIIHRDIKPSNILLFGKLQAKLADMGLAKFFSGKPEDDGAMTRTGAFMGTTDYCSPEQAEDAKRASEASDIYSLGCTLYHCLTGAAPFSGGTEVQKIVAHREKEPVRIEVHNPEVPEKFADLIHHHMLAKRPADRFLSTSDLVAALRQWAPGDASGASEINGSVLASLLEAEATAQTIHEPEEEKRDTKAERRKRRESQREASRSRSPASRGQSGVHEPAPLLRQAKSMQVSIWPPSPGILGGAVLTLGLLVAACYAAGVFDAALNVKQTGPAYISQGDNDPQPGTVTNETPGTQGNVTTTTEPPKPGPENPDPTNTIPPTTAPPNINPPVRPGPPAVSSGPLEAAFCS